MSCLHFWRVHVDLWHVRVKLHNRGQVKKSLRGQINIWLSNILLLLQKALKSSSHLQEGHALGLTQLTINIFLGSLQGCNVHAQPVCQVAQFILTGHQLVFHLELRLLFFLGKQVPHLLVHCSECCFPFGCCLLRKQRYKKSLKTSGQTDWCRHRVLCMNHLTRSTLPLIWVACHLFDSEQSQSSQSSRWVDSACLWDQSDGQNGYWLQFHDYFKSQYGLQIRDWLPLVRGSNGSSSNLCCAC